MSHRYSSKMDPRYQQMPPQPAPTPSAPMPPYPAPGQYPNGYYISPNTNMTLSLSTMKWIIGGIVYLLLQGFSIWMILDNKFDAVDQKLLQQDQIKVEVTAHKAEFDAFVIETRNSINNIKDVQNENLRYVDDFKAMKSDIGDLKNQQVETDDYQKRNWSGVLELKRRVKDLEEK